jgi:hypothetical protein
MRVFLATIVGLTALAATAIPAAPVPSNAHGSFLRYRTHKECGPIVNDRDLRNDCIRSFDKYEPFRPPPKRRS